MTLPRATRGVALAAAVLAALLTAGCNERTYVVVAVDVDPQLQPAAAQLRLVGRLRLGGVTLVESAGLYPDPAGSEPLTFPSSYIVVADGRGRDGETLQTLVELRDAGGATIGRARGEVAVQPGKQSTLEVLVRAPCATVDECLVGGTFCARPQQCVCESTDSCVEGVCEPLALDDSNECTTDGCDEASRSVTHTEVADGTACQPLGGSALDLVCVGGMCACGDGVANPASDEQCDEGPDNANAPNRCRLDPPCTLPRCNDGIVDDEYGEQCDDPAGNTWEPDRCRPDCAAPRCGDGIVDSGEECDQGDNNSDTRALACRTDCRLPHCGDGVRDNGYASINGLAIVRVEECDDGDNANEPNRCRIDPECTLPRCGDGIVDDDPAFGEQCDDGEGLNAWTRDACRPKTCELPRCGDAVVDTDEECDDGLQNRDADLACKPVTCHLPRCGDHKKDVGYTVINTAGGPTLFHFDEDCDEGASNSDTAPDACRQHITLENGGGTVVECKRAFCGDGVVDSGERCDDNNSTNRDGCNPTCSLLGTVTTIAGGPGGSGHVDGVGTAARLHDAFGLVVIGPHAYLTSEETHAYGQEDHTVRRVTIADGTITTIAGLPGVPGDADGTGTAARFSQPRGMATDGTYLYIADMGNHKLRRVDPATGAVTTVVGDGTAGSDEGVLADTRLASPRLVAARSATELYVMDGSGSEGCDLRRIDLTAGTVKTIAGNGTCELSLVNGAGTAASFRSPWGMTMSPDGSAVYVADYYTLRKVDLTPLPADVVVTTVAGATSAGFVDAVGTSARFRVVAALAAGTDVIYIADRGNHAIRSYSVSTGAVTTVVGAPPPGAAGYGDSPTVRLTNPQALAADGGTMVLGERASHTLRRVNTSTWWTETFVGRNNQQGMVDGGGADARFTGPHGLLMLGGDLLVADEGNGRIRTVTLDAGGSTVSTFATTSGPVLDLAADPTDRLFAMCANQEFWELSSIDGTPTGLTPPGTPLVLDLGYSGGATGVGVLDGHAYFADPGASIIRRVALATGVEELYAGVPYVPGVADGQRLSSLFAWPLAIEPCGGMLYVADTGYLGNVIRRIDPTTGKVTTIAGTAGLTGSEDGTGADARFDTPEALACDAITRPGDPVLYVADGNNDLVRQIVLSTSRVTTVGGLPKQGGSVDGNAAAARFNYPQGIVFDPVSRDLLVADRNEHVIRRIH